MVVLGVLLSIPVLLSYPGFLLLYCTPGKGFEGCRGQRIRCLRKWDMEQYDPQLQRLRTGPALGNWRKADVQI